MRLEISREIRFYRFVSKIEGVEKNPPACFQQASPLVRGADSDLILKFARS